MLKRNLRFLVMALLVLMILLPAYFSLVSSSTGFIRINSTSASTPGQQVQAGGKVNLYFGGVTWSGSQLQLYMSHDLFPQLSAGDIVLTPTEFLVSDLTNLTAAHTYTNGMGSWVVGNNWINGSIPQNIPVGNYTIKAFEYFSASAAITDEFIMVTPWVPPASLQISPPSGPGGITAQFAGSSYPLSANVTIAYFDPTFGSWNPLGTTTANATGSIIFTTEIPDLKKSLGIGDYPETYNQVSYRTEINGLVYSYANYNQYARGLKRVGNQTANGLYGNGTNLISSVRVKAGDNLTLSGKWFHPGVIYVRWDSVAIVGTVTSDQWRDAIIIGTSAANSVGSFETTVIIPTASAGEHYLAVEDSETRVIIKVFMSLASLQISPPSGPGGISVEFSGSGYPASTPITIAYRDPTFSSWNYLGTATSDSSGRITFTTEMPDLRSSLRNYDSSETYTSISFRAERESVVYGYADYNQYWRGIRRVGNQIASGLYGNGTNLSSTVRLRVGDALTLSGKWFHPGVVYIRWDGVAVVGTVTKDQWRSATIIGTSAANSVGSFETTVTVPTADAGEHYLSIEDSETNVIIKIGVLSSPTPTPTPTPTSSPTPTPTPAPTPTPTPSQSSAIDVSCTSTTTYSSFKVEIRGSLTSNGTAIAGAPVLLSYSVTGGSTWESLTLANTNSNGEFVAVWMPSVTGNYLIKAKWEGNSTINGASTIVNLALTPYAEQSVFSVTSNSTISEFAFNSTSKELSFIASGPSGTMGYVNVYVPKSLIADISSLRVYFDGSELTYASESQGESWLVSFNYHHSSHTIVLALSAESVAPFGGSIVEIIVTVCVPAAVIAIAAIVIVSRKRKQKQTANNS